MSNGPLRSRLLQGAFGRELDGVHYRNPEMLAQYYGNLLVTLRNADPERVAARPDLAEEVGQLLDIGNETTQGAQGRPVVPPSFNWLEGYRAELLLLNLRPAEELRAEHVFADARYRVIFDADPPANPELEAALKACENAPLTDEAADQLRRHLSKLIAFYQWETSEKHIKRELGRLYAIRVGYVALATVILFFLTLFFSDALLSAGNGPIGGHFYSGVLIAGAAGVLGATFSRLTTSVDRFDTMPLNAAKIQASLGLLGVRHIVGGISATILYFGFEAGMIDGDLFPNLSDIGFTRLSEDASIQRGGAVPNEDMSKLLIWSFAAGFSEKLVSSMLRRVADSSKSKPKVPAGD